MTVRVVTLACALVAASAASVAAEPRAVRMTVVGDSLALGIGASDSSRGFAFDLFRRVLATRPGSEVTNVAIGGATAADVDRLEAPRVEGSRPDVVVVEVGANDLVRRHATAAFSAAFDRLIAHVRRAAPHTRMVIFNVPDISVSPIFEARSKPGLRHLAIAYDGDVARTARATGATLVDLFAFSQAARRDPERYFSPDQFHPSDDGHAAIAASAWPAFERVLP